MKKLIFALTAALLTLASCGVGNVTVNSGKADKAYLSFSAAQAKDILVTVDGKEYRTETLKVKGWSGNKDLKSLSKNIITLEPGTHTVVVKDNTGKEITSQKVFISSQEHKMIGLEL
jgi:hypothetical protein